MKIGLAALLAIAMPLAWIALGATVIPRFEGTLRALGGWAEFGYAALSALAVAACAPMSLFYITGGMVFGVGWGTLLGSIAGALGSALAFSLARSALGRRAATVFAKRARVDRFERALSERPLRILLLLRLSLLFPIGPISYALGLTRIPARHFVSTSPALIPAVLTYAYAGDVARDVLGAQQRAREPWEWALLGVGLLATFGAAWLVGRAASRALARHSQPPAPERRVTSPAERVSIAPEVVLPPRMTDQQGNLRRVGVEIEFSGIGLEEASGTIVALFGGTPVRDNECELHVRGTSLGDFHVELDSHILKELAKKRRRGRVLDGVERMKRWFFGLSAGNLTPHEIATAPIPIERLGDIDRLVHALGRAGARGTDDAVWNVFGVHFNPTVPSTEPEVLLAYLRAYALLHPELVQALRVDPARRMMGYASAYPEAYIRKILAPDYEPDLSQLIDDYLEHNATRNRGLDCLPLFAHLDLERVRDASHDPRVWGRPTFHFRLPNSEVSDLAWRVTDEWKLWVEVERLAADPVRLAALSRVACSQLEIPIPLFRSGWSALGGSVADSR